ncbi:hypothetical protein BURPS1710b_A2343 [Burkholderia pseudomallei 1710b]|uniref:Uncharacterized protein n=1 Tax=Burkholderia pseudomallei (strain 1710b) TaxID=320372 RepID=Q3JG10_BURP1|nr:hypothetical protein BURPS1710b_A2343 [Burkholderia pseudomallei 1710b]
MRTDEFLSHVEFSIALLMWTMHGLVKGRRPYERYRHRVVGRTTRRCCSLRAAAVAGGGRRSGRGAAAECDCDEAGAAHGWRLVGRANAGRAGEIASAAVRDPAPSRLAPPRIARGSALLVGQRVQKRNDVAHVLLGHRGRVARLAVERRIGDVDVRAIRARDVVVLQHPAACVARIDLARIDAAQVVEREHPVERMIDAVVEEHAARRDVAQRRRREHRAVLRLRLQVVAKRPADAEIVERRIAVLRERAVARHAERLVLEIGEHRRQTVRARLRQVAARAIRLVRIVEAPHAAQLRLREPRVAFEPAVVLARIRMERRVLHLVARDREHRFGHRKTCVVEDARAEQLPEPRRVARVRELARDVAGARVRHLDRIHQRAERLLLQRIRAAVPEHPALRHELRRGRRAGALPRAHGARRGCGLGCGLLRDARRVVVLGRVRADAEVRLPVQIHQRRRRPIAGLRQRGAAQLHVQIVRRAVRMIGAVARRTRLPARRGQRGIEEQRAAELRDRAQRLGARAAQRDRLRIRAREVFDDRADRVRHVLGKRQRERGEAERAERGGRRRVAHRARVAAAAAARDGGKRGRRACVGSGGRSGLRAKRFGHAGAFGRDHAKEKSGVRRAGMTAGVACAGRPCIGDVSGARRVRAAPRRACAAHRSDRRRGCELRAERRIEVQRRLVHRAREIEQIAHVARGRIERAAADPLAAEPVVLDEAHDRRLIDQRVAHVVLLRPRRHDDERNPRAGTAAAVDGGAVDARRRGAGAARAVAVQLVDRIERRARRRGVRMVVPAVRVVIRDDHRGARPVGLLLQEVDDLRHELLLVERIRVAGVRVLRGGRLQEADRREVARLHGREEVVRIVLVIRGLGRLAVRLDARADRRDRARARVLRVRGRRVVLEPVVVRDVVGRRRVHRGRDRAALAARRAVRVRRRQIEAAHEAAPRDVARVQQIADVLAGHHRLIGRARAHVVAGVDIVDHREAALAVVDVVRRLRERRHGLRRLHDLHPVGLAGDHVQRARRRRAVGRRVCVVAHREALRVVPQRGHRVAVEVTHHLAGRAERARAAARAVARVFREEIGETVVVRLLLGGVRVVLIGRRGLCAVEAERIARARAVRRIRRVRVRGEQQARQAVDRRRARRGAERRLARRVRGVRVGAEVVVERHVLAVDHDEMLDRRRGPQCVLRRDGRVAVGAAARIEGDGRSGARGGDPGSTKHQTGLQ